MPVVTKIEVQGLDPQDFHVAAYLAEAFAKAATALAGGAQVEVTYDAGTPGTKVSTDEARAAEQQVLAETVRRKTRKTKETETPTANASALTPLEQAIAGTPVTVSEPAVSDAGSGIEVKDIVDPDLATMLSGDLGAMLAGGSSATSVQVNPYLSLDKDTAYAKLHEIGPVMGGLWLRDVLIRHKVRSMPELTVEIMHQVLFDADKELARRKAEAK